MILQRKKIDDTNDKIRDPINEAYLVLGYAESLGYEGVNESWFELANKAIYSDLTYFYDDNNKFRIIVRFAHNTPDFDLEGFVYDKEDRETLNKDNDDIPDFISVDAGSYTQYQHHYYENDEDYESYFEKINFNPYEAIKYLAEAINKDVPDWVSEKISQENLKRFREADEAEKAKLESMGISFREETWKHYLILAFIFLLGLIFIFVLSNT